ncbi:MAG: hypothetical protein C5S43_01230 [Candidatus Methanocomedens sp.]|nr:MAG: hypothetical protein C5S43_01230 [ANME-2 cluster archaeon]
MLNTISAITMKRIINLFLSVIVIYEKMIEEIILQENNE